MYRPYKDRMEFTDSLKERLGMLWVRGNGGIFLITGVSKDRVFICDHWVRFDTLFSEYKHADGSPCGVEVQE